MTSAMDNLRVEGNGNGLCLGLGEVKIDGDEDGGGERDKVVVR